VKEHKEPNHVFKSNFERLYKKWNMQSRIRRPEGAARRKRSGGSSWVSRA
jgi:hypothetical protein